MGKVTKKGRLKATAGLGEFINSEKMRLFDGATPERQAQFRRAERRHVIFQAWNKVCAGTREGKHVTGLHYVAERDELIVYTDGASWTQELTMMREIVRARMDACGGAVGNIVVKTTPASSRVLGNSGTVPDYTSEPKSPQTASQGLVEVFGTSTIARFTFVSCDKL